MASYMDTLEDSYSLGQEVCFSQDYKKNVKQLENKKTNAVTTSKD